MVARNRIVAAVAALFIAGFQASAQVDAVKFTFLGWITGSTKVSYERAFGETVPQSGEIAVGLIGAGGDKFGNNPEGITVRYGHKFFIGEHESALKGWFLRPEIIGTDFRYDRSDGSQRRHSKMAAMLATAGYQYVRAHFIIDSWVGGGYCAGNPADTGYEHGFTVWNYLGRYNPHVAMSFSIRLGYCF